MEKLAFELEMQNYARSLNMVFQKEQLEQFWKYMNILIQWNQKFNLTAIIEPKEIILKHFIDCLTMENYIKKNCTLIDVGTGAGFPGIPLKIMRPDITIVLVDSLKKRVTFLEEVIAQLGLTGIQAIHGRAEELARQKQYREMFDYATSRAVANLSVLVEYLLPFVKKGGTCICMKGSDIEQELKQADNAIKTVGGKVNQVHNFCLPECEIKRNIVIVDKKEKTSQNYPRKAGLPSKHPIT